MKDDRNDYEENEMERARMARDEAWPGVVPWDLGAAHGYVGNMVWRCDALRAGKLYSRSLFGSQEEARQFVARMQEKEPDQMFRVESVQASTMWN
jgi:hypothetical protein